MLIRKAEEKDVHRIVHLVNLGGPVGKREDLPDALPPIYAETFRKIVSDPNAYLMVAELDGVVVGTFHLTLITYLAAKGREDAQIEAVHVAEKLRGQQIGTQMMKWAIDFARARNCRRLQLTTDKRRADSHRFYERLGFVATHEGMKLVL